MLPVPARLTDIQGVERDRIDYLPTTVLLIIRISVALFALCAALCEVQFVNK